MSAVIDNESLRSDLRKIRRNGFTFEVTNGEQDFRQFYDEMYLPYISLAHGDQAFLANYLDLKRQFRKCQLLFVMRQQERIAGITILFEKNEPRLLCLGVKDGDYGLVRDGAAAAAYYFSLSYLKEEGYRRVNLGGSRPFLDDGVLKYKKKWHPTVVGPVESALVIDPISESTAVQAFFLNNPFIDMTYSAFRGVVFVSGGRSMSEADAAVLQKKYQISGMKGLSVYNFEAGRGAVEVTSSPAIREPGATRQGDRGGNP